MIRERYQYCWAEVIGANGVRCFVQLFTLLLLLGQTGCDRRPTKDSGTNQDVRDEVAETNPAELQKVDTGRDEKKAQERDTTESSRSTETIDTANALVDQLASRNPPPQKTESRRKLAISKDFNWSEQGRVKRLWQELLARSDDCFPELVAHLDDDRYSITYSRITGFRNYSVGDICLSIVSKRLEEFVEGDDPEIPRDLALQWVRMARDERRPWIEAHTGMSLAELQLEGLREMERNLASMAEDDSVKDLYLKRVEAFQRTVRSTKKPIPYHGEAFHTHDEFDAIEFLSSQNVIVREE